MTQTITSDYILKLFEKSPTVIITENNSDKRKYGLKTKRTPDQSSRNLRQIPRINYNEFKTDSPGRTAIREYAGLTPRSEKVLDKLITTDTEKIIEIETKQEKLDSLYKQYYDTELGVFIEKWICSKMKCPGCKIGTLLKFVNASFPVIDVKCDGLFHDIQVHGPLYFQIKATNGFSMSGSYPNYFDLKSQKEEIPYIKIGSKKFGELSHSVKVNSSLDTKKLLIGYICVYYNKTTSQSGSNILSLNFNKSFILIPDISKTGVSDNYYTYIDGEPATITFDKKQFKVANTFNELKLQDIFKPINTNTEFSEREYLPESDTEKRMKMMQKYFKI